MYPQGYAMTLLQKLSHTYFFKTLYKDDAAATAKTDDFKEVGRASYIKGDPLNGYYDFVITEGSYKFWVIFQVSSSTTIHLDLPRWRS